MQGIEADSGNQAPRVTVESDVGSPDGVQRAADAASAVARALSKAGYEPRHLSVTSSDSGELVLVARLDPHPRAAAPQVPTQAVAAPRSTPSRTPTLARLAIGLTAGVLLGFLGLPRLEVPALNSPAASPAAPQSVAPVVGTANDTAVQTLVPPTLVPATPTVIVPTPTPAPLFADQLTRPLPGWPNNPQSTAWFSAIDYRLLARDSGHFVAIGVPLGKPVRDVKLSARFHKVGGPSGGGYGLIVRDQGATGERDGRSQSGRYVVVEVGDRGDIGIWQREDTHWIDIVPWQHSDAVHLDHEPNAMTLTTHGTGLQFVVNGQTVAEVSDNALPIDGGVGVFVGGDLNEVALESLRIDATN